MFPLPASSFSSCKFVEEGCVLKCNTKGGGEDFQESEVGHGEEGPGGLKEGLRVRCPYAALRQLRAPP